jgi:hypothetical protein
MTYKQMISNGNEKQHSQEIIITPIRLRKSRQEKQIGNNEGQRHRIHIIPILMPDLSFQRTEHHFRNWFK